MRRKSNFLSINRRDIFPKISFQRYDKQRTVRYRDLYVAQTKYHLNPVKNLRKHMHCYTEPRVLLGLIDNIYLDIDWNESEELFRVNGNLNRRPEFYNLLEYMMAARSLIVLP